MLFQFTLIAGIDVSDRATSHYDIGDGSRPGIGTGPPFRMRTKYHMGLKAKALKLGVAAHTCGPSCSRGGDWKDLGSRTAPGKKFMKHHLNSKKLGMMVPVIPARQQA
jgi:hypothetical protein